MSAALVLATSGVPAATPAGPVPPRGGAQQPAVSPARPTPPRPDLRIVRIEVEQEPVGDGATARLRVMLHNRSTAVAAGGIAVQIAHDRTTPQPQPALQEILYFGGDALAEVTFDVPRMSLHAAPYTFFAMVDVARIVDEDDETNNTAWRRVAVCGDPQAAEQADGRDNDCDGLVDEELGLPPDPGDALRMLRELQQRARWDAVPLIYALPRPFAPAPTESSVRLVSEEGGSVGPRGATARGGRRGRGGGAGRGGRGGRGDPAPLSELTASLTAEDAASLLTLRDWDGERLRSGDLISFTDLRGAAIAVVGGNDGPVVLHTRPWLRETLFTLVKVDAPPRDPVADGDAIALATAGGWFVTADRGGGGPLRAEAEVVAGWEIFTISFDPEVAR